MDENTLRQRQATSTGIDGSKGDDRSRVGESTADSEGEVFPGLDLNSSKQMAGGTNKLDDYLSFIPSRWRNWVVRGVFTWVMIVLFGYIIYLGPLAVVLLIMCVQVKCFQEIITIGYTVYKSHNLPWFRTLSWYFLFASNYFFYGESLVQYFGILLARNDFLSPFVRYHRFISFSLYTAGIVWFVLSLVKKHYIKQFTLFGWTHVALLIVVASSHLMIQNTFEGMIWLLLPTSLVITNDIWAYIFGFFFGRTPLIKLSPKKTWEGFLGGAFSTVLFSFIVSTWMLRFNYMICPLSYSDGSVSYDCDPNPVFQRADYALPRGVVLLLSLFRSSRTTVTLYPFQLHAVFLSLFASIIGPFGGFFASGFKRAFRIKDFGDTIPGHGGLMDRFDCQVMMAGFVHVYISSFIKAPSVSKVLQHVLMLKPDEQLGVYQALQQSLDQRGLL